MAKCAAIQFYSTFKCIFWTTLLMIGKFLWSHSKLKRAFFKAAATNSSESSPFSLANFWIRSICLRFVNTDNSWTNVEATFPLDANLKIWAQKSKKLIFPATRLEISINWVRTPHWKTLTLNWCLYAVLKWNRWPSRDFVAGSKLTAMLPFWIWTGFHPKQSNSKISEKERNRWNYSRMGTEKNSSFKGFRYLQ